MYSIWADGLCIHNDAYLPQGYKVISPKLTLEDNAAGSLVMTLPPANVGYSSVQRLASEITVKRDGTEIWSGRVIDEKRGFHNSRVLTCEGELAYLNDTIQPPVEYQGYTLRGLLEAIIAVHNSMSEKQFTVGVVTVAGLSEDSYRYTNYESTLDFIKTILTGKHGGHIRVRKANGIRYLDYLSDWASTNSQVIRFGTNLLDFTTTWNMTELATAIIPRGARLGDVFNYDHAVMAVTIQRGVSSEGDVEPTRWVTGPVYGAYIWQRLELTLRNGQTERTKPVKIVSPRSDSVTVEGNQSQYYLSVERSGKKGGEWVAEPPAYKENRYYYCRTEIEWSDGTVTYVGETLAKSSAEDTNAHPDDYLTVASVNDGDIYLKNEEAVSSYGWIARVVDFSEVTNPATLLERGMAYLSDSQFEKLTLNLTAVDLHYLNPDVKAIDLLDQIRCVSAPHGMNRYFPVTKMTIPLDKPEETTYVLGIELKSSLTSNLARVQNSADSASNQATSARQSFLTMSSNQEQILREAKENATSIINQATNGYITIVQGTEHSEELIISDTPDYTNAARLWRWNINGLGYSRDGGRTYGLAMTMDGAIVADFITTGTLNAGIIKAGTITSVDDDVKWDLDSGVLWTEGYSSQYSGYYISTLQAGSLTLSWRDEDSSSERKIGSSHLLTDINNNALKGWAFDLEHTGDYICWAVQNTEGGTYWYKMIYCRNDMRAGDGYYRGDRISFNCDVDMLGYQIHHVWLGDEYYD